MLEMNPSRPEDWAACKALWKTVFKDTDEYIDNYYQNQYAPEKLLVLREEREIRAMLALFDCQHRWEDGGTTRASYLYALATRPDSRGRGYAGGLLRYADFYLQNQGVPFLTTVPAEPALQAFFARYDFQPCHPMEETDCTAPAPRALPVEQIGGEAYFRLRETLLEGRAHAVYPPEYLDYQAAVSKLNGGGLFRVQTPEGEACAVVERWQDLLDLRELLAPAGWQKAALSALAARFPEARRCRVRCPDGTGELPGGKTRIFGMAKRIPPTGRRLSESYFPLAFD